MKEIAYIIDKEQSLKDSSLAIRIVYLDNNDSRQGFNIKEIEKSLTPQDKLALQFLFKDESKLPNFLSVPANQTTQALKLMAATGKLYFNGKQLACDFYGKTDFSYLVDAKENGEFEVAGKLKWNGGECSLAECDFIGAGSPHFFIKGNMLKMIGSDVTWKELNRLMSSPKYSSKEIKELQEAHEIDPTEPKVNFSKNSELVMKFNEEPLPFLVLKDKTGAFADLWIDYGHDKKCSYHDISTKIGTIEKGYEKDLLETDFTPKLMAKSHYYCPLDRVAKSLTFLMEIGWKIYDYQGRRLVRHTDYEMKLTKMDDLIEVKGSLNYESHEVNLFQVVGAFNRRERFVEISENSVGLIPDSFDNKTLDALTEISEVVQDRILFKRHQIGAIDELLDDHSIVLNEEVKALRDSLKNFEGISFALPKENFKGILRPYQQEGVNFLKFLYDFHFSGLLADDMGLGKTVQVLAFISQLKFTKPILIVLPASLVFNWQLEIKRFTPDFKVLVHHGMNREADFPVADIILTTYGTLRSDLETFKAVEFECVILDEAQTIKNAHTQIAKACFSLRSRFRLSITGTPIENHLGELWSQFRFLMPEVLGDEKSFLSDLQAATSDSRYLKKIKKKIRPFILRRKKEEVAKDLPEKIEQTVFVEMGTSQRKVYEEYLSGVKNSLIKKVDLDGFSKHRMEVLEAILRLRQICCHPILVSGEVNEGEFCSAKMDILLEDIETAISEGRKILVYSQFTKMLKLIAKSVAEKGFKYVYLDGQTVNREKVVSSFQEDPEISLFLISLKAGGVGLNLTAADYVFLYDPWWNEAIENQAINRAHRIGRKETVFAKRYIVRESIEEKMMTLKQNKAKQASDILDDELAELNLTADDFKFLLS